MAQGQGLNSSSNVNATTKPHVSPKGQTGSEGESAGVGSSYSARLVERENKSNPRNQGPTRENSVQGSTSLPVATMDGRKVPRVGMTRR